jgi:hypothetical protein
LRNAASTPFCRSASTWSCISAISGDTTRRAVAHERRHLIAEGFAAAGRHQHERIATADKMVDYCCCSPRNCA